MTVPVIEVKRDYDGYFEGLVRGILKQVPNPRSERIVINSGPYRPSAVTYAWDEATKTMTLDFYSALRRGFGSLSTTDLVALGQLL